MCNVVFDVGLYDQKAFYNVKIVFYSSSKAEVFWTFFEKVNPDEIDDKLYYQASWSHS